MTSTSNEMTSIVSPQGRRVLVAVVTGEAGARIQAWRETYDPEQARRLPPHTTLCYWVPAVELDLLGRQIQHAFAEPVTVQLGGVHEFDNDQHTFYVSVEQTGPLDEARVRLYDGTHLSLARAGSWTWHITCVRESLGRDLDVLRDAASTLSLDLPWRVDTVACLELRGDSYQSVAVWRV